MLRKLIWTTIISIVIYGASALAYYLGWFNIARLSRLMGLPL
jgi:predicted secreted protein